MEASSATALVVQDAATLERLLPQLPVRPPQPGGPGPAALRPPAAALQPPGLRSERARPACSPAAPAVRNPRRARRPLSLDPRPPMQDGCDLAVVLWGEVPHAAVEASHHQLLAVSYEELVAKVGARASTVA